MRSVTSDASRHPWHSATIAAGALCAALVLPACAPMNAMPAPESRVDLGALGAARVSIDWPREDWWRRYGDAQLDALETDALAGSPTLASARARVARATAAAGVARAALLPAGFRQRHRHLPALFRELHFSAAFRGKLGRGQPPHARLRLRDRFLEQERRRAQRRAVTGAGRRRRCAGRARAADDQHARAYFNLQRLFAQREVSRATIAQREDVVRLTAERFAAGLDTKVEVRQAEAALATVRTELAQYDDTIVIVRHQLAALAGAGPQRGDSLVAIAPAHAPASALPAAIPLDLARPPPRNRRVALARRGRRQRRRSREGAVLPERQSRCVRGAHRRSGCRSCSRPRARIGGIGPAIHLPIFEGGRLNANLRGREADAGPRVSAYNQAVIDAVRDVADALSSIDHLARIAAEQARAREATTDAYNLAVIRYRAGLGNYLTVLTAQTQQLVQDRLDADLKARAFELDVNLARALGGGFADVTPVNLSAAAPMLQAR